nr:putative transposase Y4QE [Bradyrhizobium sp. DOA9]
MADYREAFVRTDVAKLSNAVAIAEAGRKGEVRFFGVDASAVNMCRVIVRVASRRCSDVIRITAAVSIVPWNVVSVPGGRSTARSRR